MTRPVIGLLSDFGLADHYVGTMKGVIAGIAPDANVIDITHEIPPFDIATGAYELAATYAYFPQGSVFVSVVDPGVGSARRAIAAEIDGFRFVAPDNGILTDVLSSRRPSRAVELREGRFALAHVSRTFEGRDRFAPAAAWLATGVDLDEFGPRVDDLVRLERPIASQQAAGLVGAVLRVDRFGNAVTNIGEALLASLSGEGPLVVRLHGTLHVPVVESYSAVALGAGCAVIGSSGLLELAINRGRAVELLRATPGVPVHVVRHA